MTITELIKHLNTLSRKGTEFKRTVCRLSATALEEQQRKIECLQNELRRIRRKQMEILKIIEALQVYDEAFIAYKIDGNFAHAVTEAIGLLIRQGEQIADLQKELEDERYRHDRYVDFELAEAAELRNLKLRWLLSHIPKRRMRTSPDAKTAHVADETARSG